MTLAAACGWSLARGILIALVAWPVCHRQSTWLRSEPSSHRQRAWWLLVVPFLCPELWAGYAWSGFAVKLAGTSLWQILPTSLFPTPRSIVLRDAAVDELLLDLLLFFRAVPVGTLALYFTPPPPISPEALHCWNLSVGQAFQPDALGPQTQTADARPSSEAHSGNRARGRNPFSRLSTLRVRLECLTDMVPAITLMFMVAFQEFELASLIGRPAWTVWLFDAQVGGLALSESLRKTVLPVLCQLAVLVPLAWLIVNHRGRDTTRRDHVRLTPLRGRIISWGVILGGIVALCVVPAVLVGQGTFDGLLRISRSAPQVKMMFREIFIGLSYAVVAGLASAGIAGFLLQAVRRSRWMAVGLCAAALPGLIGSLVLGLVLIRLLQLPMLRFAYKSPLSLTAGLILFLLPRALLLRFLLRTSAQPEAEHVARLLAKSPAVACRKTAWELAWQMRWRGEFWGAALLAYWGFFDLTTASLLAPVTIVSAPVMLYNQMHFGKNAILSALVLLTVLVPLAVFAVAAWARRLFFRWLWR